MLIKIREKLNGRSIILSFKDPFIIRVPPKKDSKGLFLRLVSTNNICKEQI
jgi:hypothetical protein